MAASPSCGYFVIRMPVLMEETVAMVVMSSLKVRNMPTVCRWQSLPLAACVSASPYPPFFCFSYQQCPLFGAHKLNNIWQCWPPGFWQRHAWTLWGAYRCSCMYSFISGFVGRKNYLGEAKAFRGGGGRNAAGFMKGGVCYE